jgi:hypothetical protein
MDVIVNTNNGFLGFEGNEESIGSKENDPCKLRLTTPVYPDGGGGGVISFNASRNPGVVQDGHNQQEMGFIRVEQSESVRGQTGNLRGEMNFFLNDGSGQDDASMVRAFAIECDRITKAHPGLVQSLRNLLGVSGGFSPDHMTSPQGRFQTHQQEDGNFVTYDTSTTPWTAVWSAWTGRIG